MGAQHDEGQGPRQASSSIEDGPAGAKGHLRVCTCKGAASPCAYHELWKQRKAAMVACPERIFSDRTAHDDALGLGSAVHDRSAIGHCPQEEDRGARALEVRTGASVCEDSAVAGASAGVQAPRWRSPFGATPLLAKSVIEQVDSEHKTWEVTQTRDARRALTNEQKADRAIINRKANVRR